MTPNPVVALPRRALDPPLPRPRGPISAALGAHLRGRGHRSLPSVERGAGWSDEDAHLALYCCYELHYRGFADVDPEREWDPQVLTLRRALEDRFLVELADAVGPVPDLPPHGVEQHLLSLATTSTGPSLSTYVAERATLDQLREFCIHRSGYQSKEADPHTWCLPRLGGTAKAAMVEIQADEYGNGVRDEMHAELFAATLRGLDLDDSYGAYLDRLPAVTLATTNLVSLFGLHRRWRGALVGHLALFEMTSVGPMSRYAAAIDRFGGPSSARRFYDVHVDIDDHHRVVALEEMVRGLLADEPDLGADVIFGAEALTAVERRFADHLLGSWAAQRTSLLGPEADAPTPAGLGSPVLLTAHG
ncbi:MAG: iron-containing redox enzyme family protein [Acidimicrobiales bacterium]